MNGGMLKAALLPILIGAAACLYFYVTRHELTELVFAAPVVIFSKTYCPHCRRAKQILTEELAISPPPVVIELDVHERGEKLQRELAKLTARRTVPNIIVQGKSIGGRSDIEEIYNAGRLEAYLIELAHGAVNVTRPAPADEH